MRNTSRLLTGFFTFLSISAVNTTSAQAFGPCTQGDEKAQYDYYDAGNHRCLYGSCSDTCDHGKNVNPDRYFLTTHLCIYCADGFTFQQASRRCMPDVTPLPIPIEKKKS